MAKNVGELPEGFVLDEENNGLPEGFVLDENANIPESKDSFSFKRAIAPSVFGPLGQLYQTLPEDVRNKIAGPGGVGGPMGVKTGLRVMGLPLEAVSKLIGFGQEKLKEVPLAKEIYQSTAPLTMYGPLGQIGGKLLSPEQRENLTTETVTNVGGTLASVPVYKALGKLFNMAISPKGKLSSNDKVLLDSSQNIYSKTKNARDQVISEISSFRDATKETRVDLKELNEAVRRLYGKTAKDVGEILPEGFRNEMKLLVEEATDSNLGVVYKVKDTISKHINKTTWRKFKTGQQLLPDQEKLIRSYFDFDKLIDNSLQKAGLLEEKQMLDYLNKKATDLFDITGQINGMVIDAIGKPQKTSAIQTIFFGEGNPGKKVLFHQLAEFEPEILNITGGLERYRKFQEAKRMLARFGLGAGITLGGYHAWSGLRKTLSDISSGD